VDWTTLAALGSRAAVGLGLNLAFGALAYLARAIDVSGWAAGVAVGTVIYAFLGWRGWLLLGVFFVLGTAATKLGYAKKAARRLAQEAGGRRSARHVLANAGVPALAALGVAATPFPEACVAAFAAALAAATSDTLESEIGQLWGRRTVLITTLTPVPSGTDGGVSLVGTTAGLAGSAVVAAVGWALGLYAAPGMLVVASAGLAGSLVDSVLGATLERRRLLGNEAVNFLCTLAAAVLAAVGDSLLAA